MKHLTKMHGDLVYKCEYENCSASFRLKKELTDHYATHTAEGWECIEEEQIQETEPEFEIIAVEDSYMEHSQM